MGSHGKKYLDSALKVDREKTYTSREALELIKEMAYARFDEAVEAHLRLGVDPRHADQQVRGVISLPAGTGKTVRIMAFVEGEAAAEAEAAGADYVGIDEYVQKIQDGWLEFDIALAVPQAMGKIGRLGRVLGPRGLMPSPKSGTMVQPDAIGSTIEQLRQGRVEFRVDRTSNLHVAFGKTSFDVDDLMANWKALVTAIVRARPASVRGQYMRRVTLTSTMGPGVKVDVADVLDLV
jgi:large subunit ribosomal protein L1